MLTKGFATLTILQFKEGHLRQIRKLQTKSNKTSFLWIYRFISNLTIEVLCRLCRHFLMRSYAIFVQRLRLICRTHIVLTPFLCIVKYNRI